MSFIFDNVIFSLQKGGGVSLYWFEMFKRMCRDGYQLSAIEYPGAMSNIFRSKMSVSPGIVSEIKGLPVSLLRYLPCSISPGRRRLFLSSYYRLPADRSLPSVMTVYDFTYEKYRKGFPRFVHSLQKKKAVAAASAIICISENSKRDLMEFCPEIPADRISVIYLGVSEAYRPIKGQSVNLMGPHWKDAPYVLFVGGRHSYKNFDLAVRAVSKVPGFLLVSAGGGPLSCVESDMVGKELPGRHMHFPSLRDEDLNILYNKAHAFLYPSSYEGFGLPVLESMAAGCPVIAVSSSSIPEVAGDAAILTDKPDPVSFADAIVRLTDATLRAEYISKGFARVQLFSWEKCYRETLAVYIRVMRKHNVPVEYVRDR